MGYWGVNVQEGQSYTVSLYLRTPEVLLASRPLLACLVCCMLACLPTSDCLPDCTMHHIAGRPCSFLAHDACLFPARRMLPLPSCRALPWRSRWLS